MAGPPIERFKSAYENHRYNPFTGADMAVLKDEGKDPDLLYIPSGSPFVIQLLELPRLDVPSTVSVYCYDDEMNYVEVATPPTQGQFRVDYPPEDGQGTGLVEFNQADAGKRVWIQYNATGSPALAEFLDTKVSYPAGNPSDHQILGFVSGAPEWRYNPIRYFHEGSVIYHASGEAESCLFFRFKKSAKEATAILELKGAKLHQGYYTELMAHNHAAGTLAAAAAGVHSHAKGSLGGTQPLHNHPISGSSGVQDTNHNHAITDTYHRHGGGGAGDPTGYENGCTTPTGNQSVSHKHNAGTFQIGNAGNDAVTIDGDVADGGSHGHPLSGSTANAGGSPKEYPNQLKVYINSVDKTAEILALTALTQFGDGTVGHAFITTGSGEMDISSLVSANQFHEIKITESIAGNGGRCLLHLELY